MTTLHTASINATSVKVAQGALWVTTEEKVTVDMDQCLLIEEEDALLHYGISDTGVVNFGIWYEDKHKRPGHGGYWSSRAGIVSPLLDLPMIDVVINRTAMHMTVPAVESLLAAHGLDSHYHVVERNSYGEVVYEVVVAHPTGFCHIHQDKLYGGESCYTCEDMAEHMIMEDK